MTSVVVDTNVLLSFLLDRDAEQQQRASDLIHAAAARELELDQQVITELIYVLLNLYDHPRQAIAQIVRELLALPGVRTVDSVDWDRVLELWPETFRDFADAVLAATCQLGRHGAVATFDEGCARLLGRIDVGSYW